MNSSLYIGATGMKGLAEGMSVTTNNLANVSTIGYKQQQTLFSDLISQTQASMGNWWNAQDDSRVAIGQVGMGLQIEAVRTIFTEGALESSNTMTDLAINGKGFFQVSDGVNSFYTRAGDFRSDSEGVWRTPSGLALSGFPIDSDGNRGELSSVKINETEAMKAKPTSNISLSMNLGQTAERSYSESNPYFALLGQYDATSATPISEGSYSSSQAITVYDAEGNSHTVTAYFDSAPSNSSNRYMEFIIATEPSGRFNEDGQQLPNERGDGLLMSGILEFDAQGNLLNISSFTPEVEGDVSLENWTAASLVDGKPAFSIGGQQISMDFGLASSGGWLNTPVNAAAVGDNAAGLPQMAEAFNTTDYPTTSFGTSTMVDSYQQDGYSSGVLSNIAISSDGVVTGYFSNGQQLDLWEIPVCRFVSEDGLRREGGNLFSAAPEAGQMEMGTAGTENYGTILAYNIETSNVDMAQEMVNMILTQRGFQSNSKVVTTSDQMLQKAMELKRS